MDEGYVGAKLHTSQQLRSYKMEKKKGAGVPITSSEPHS
jgi:hypothetical protein